MPQTVAELLNAALALTETERAELAELIGATIPTPPSSLHPEWPEELRRRLADVESGHVLPISWVEAQRHVQAQLDAGVPSNG